MPDGDPKPGETWKWLLVWAYVVRSGPKFVYWHSGDGNVVRSPRERFLDRFHLTGLDAALKDVPR